MQTIVINLPSDDDRWVDVRRQFHRAGIRPVFHEATEGRGLTAEERSRLYSETLRPIEADLIKLTGRSRVKVHGRMPLMPAPT